MDMRQLIAQIDHLENKQILNEHAHYTAAPVDNRPRVSKSNNQTSIYEMLIKEFGYDLGEQTLDEVAFSPEQQAKMGQANPQDPYIVARVLGKTAVPLSHFTDPADQAIAKQLGFKDGVAGSAAQPAAAPAAAQAALAPAAAAPAGTAAQPAATPAVSNPQNPGGMSDEEMLAQQQAAPGSAAQPAAIDASGPSGGMGTGAAPAGAAAQPAKPAANKSMTPAINAYASRMGLMKNNKPDVAAIKKFQQDNGLKADGIIGPNTAGAIISAGSGPNMGGGGGGPAPAAQRSSAKVPAMPDPNRRTGTMAQRDEWMAKYGKTHNMDGTPKEPAGSGAQPAPAKPLPGKTPFPGAGQISDNPAAESIRSQDDAILERIRTALFR